MAAVAKGMTETQLKVEVFTQKDLSVLVVAFPICEPSEAEYRLLVTLFDRLATNRIGIGSSECPDFVFLKISIVIVK